MTPNHLKSVDIIQAASYVSVNCFAGAFDTYHSGSIDGAVVSFTVKAKNLRAALLFIKTYTIDNHI